MNLHRDQEVGVSPIHDLGLTQVGIRGQVLANIKQSCFIPTIPLLIVALLVLTALLAPWIAPHSPTQGMLADSLTPPAWMAGGKSTYLLGTDRFGIDVVSRLIYGARISITISIIAVFFSGAVGTAIGLISGYFGGWVDTLLMRLTDVGLSMPLILMAILLAVILGPSYTNVIVVIMLLLWPRYARQIRGETLVIKEQDFVALARISGRSTAYIVLRHIFPNIMPTLLVLATLQIGFVILLESSLSFLGVGIPPPTPSWGIMIAEGLGLINSAWWMTIFPGAALFLLVISMNLLGDWMRDRFDPKLRQI